LKSDVPNLFFDIDFSTTPMNSSVAVNISAFTSENIQDGHLAILRHQQVNSLTQNRLIILE
jgi:hypothetical protein